jgi:RecB family exonuclease
VRLDAARAWLARLPRDAQALVLAPHGYAADELVRGDVASVGTRFGIQRLTVDRLAARLAAPELARRGIAPATSLALAAVVARGVHHLIATGEAGRFAEIAGRPGFPHAVVRTLEELRGAGIKAETLGRIEPWGPDLAAIVARVELEMEALHLADRAAMLALACEAIEQGGAAPVGLPMILLDLPLALALEADLVAALAARAPAVFATAPVGDVAAIGRLEKILDSRAEIADDATERSLERLQRHLFGDSRPAFRAADESVRLHSWPGEARECVEIARRIQAEAARGVPFDRMAIFLRAPSAYRAHLEEALRRAAIPAYFARGATRPDPAGRAFLALLACAAEGLSARRFAEYLSLAQVPDSEPELGRTWAPPDHDLLPSAVVEPAPRNDGEPIDTVTASEGALSAPWRWEHLLVDAAVIGGRERWRRRLAGLAEELAVQRREVAEDDARAAGLVRLALDLQHLTTFALPVIDRLATLPTEATWREWLDHLRGLAGAAIRQPSRVLEVLAELEPLGPVGPIDLTSIQHVLTPRLRELVLREEGRPAGAVFVAPTDGARGWAFEIVFVPGLSERIFPQRIVEDPLLPDEARKDLGADGPLAIRPLRVANERLSLRLAVGAARERVALSWPRIDLEQARPRVPSFYGLEALRAAEGRLPGFDELRRRAEGGGRVRLGWPAPERPEDAIDDTEYDLSLLARLVGEDEKTSVGAASYLLGANPHLARALRARGRRWLKRWTPADGLVDPDPETRAALERHRMGARSFSPTALENFSACPYRFFLQAIHRLQPRKEAEALETVDPLTRGALFHEVQFQVLTALREAGRLPVDATHLEGAIATLDEAFERIAMEYEERLAPAIPRVWTDGMNGIRADLREWLRRASEGSQGWVPYRFELSFGLAARARPTADASSVIEPVAVLNGALLRGSIDLVERRMDGVLRVTDHKTGKARVDDDAVVNGGATLQPVLYAMAAERLLAAPVASGRLYYCTADGDFTERVIELNETSRASAGSALSIIGGAIDAGFLPAAPSKGACMWCDYRMVCGPLEEIRTARKPADRLTDLTNLRDLP